MAEEYFIFRKSDFSEKGQTIWHTLCFLAKQNPDSATAIFVHVDAISIFSPLDP